LVYMASYSRRVKTEIPVEAQVFAYFDTSFLNWLVDRRVTAASISYMRRRRFTAPVSPVVFDEILATPDRDRLVKLFELALEVCDTSLILKPVHQLLVDEIRASVANARSNPFLATDSAQELLDYYSGLLRDDHALVRARAGLKQRNQNWKNAFGAFHRDLQSADPNFTRKTIAPPFQEHYQRLAPGFARDWARWAGISENFEPSVLLDNRIVRAGISYALALEWDHRYGPRGDRPVEPSDAPDLQHAILAAAASAALVVRDRIFKARLERASVVEPFEVLDFDEFVTRVL
jgi:hypothetical protein